MKTGRPRTLAASRGFEGDPYDFLPDEKACLCCGEVKPAHDFTVIYQHHSRLPALFSYCKPCQSEKVRTRAAEARIARGSIPQTPTSYYTIGDQTMTLYEWAKQPGCECTYRGVYTRIRNGWSIEDAVFKPLGKTGRKRKKSK